MQAVDTFDKTAFFLNTIKDASGPIARAIFESKDVYLEIETIKLGDRVIVIKEEKLSFEDRERILHEKQKEIITLLCKKDDIEPEFIESLLENLGIKEREWQVIALLNKKLSQYPENDLKGKTTAEQFILIMRTGEGFPSSFEEGLKWI